MKELVAFVDSWVNLLFMHLNIIVSKEAGQQPLYQISGLVADFFCCLEMLLTFSVR